MGRTVVESCDLCGEFRKHEDLMTVHVVGEPVDVCTACQAKPITELVAEARSRNPAVVTVTGQPQPDAES